MFKTGNIYRPKRKVKGNQEFIVLHTQYTNDGVIIHAVVLKGKNKYCRICIEGKTKEIENYENKFEYITPY